MRKKLKGKAISSERFFTRTMMKYGPIASNLREFTRCSGSNVDGRTEFMKKERLLSLQKGCVMPVDDLFCRQKVSSELTY